ncbi:hypothetical protein EDC44_1251, partial [Cricetibacter osteomyelitidis]
SPNDTGAEVNPTTGVVNIPADKVKDGEPINATGTDEKGNTAPADSKNAGDNPEPDIPQVDINKIADQAQIGDDTGDSDVYAQLTPTLNTNGYKISGTATNVSDGTEVTVTINDGNSDVVIVKTTVSSGTWAVDISPNAITNFSATTEYKITASVTENGTSATDTDVTIKVPTVGISVTGDITNDVLYPATEEDTKTETVLTYTVSIDKPTTTDTVVKVALTGRSEPTVDYKIYVNGTETQGIEHNVNVGEGEDAILVKGRVIEVKIPAGSTSATFTIDPIREAAGDQFNFEGPETVIASVQADNAYAVKPINSEANNGGQAIGLILDADPIALPHLNGDLSLAYGTSSSALEKNQNANKAWTVSTVPGKDNGKDTGDAIIMTDRGDKLYIGYYSNGRDSDTKGNFANYADGGASREKTDGRASTSTIDMGKGDDILKIRGSILTNGDDITGMRTHIYLGEGNDKLELNGQFGDGITTGDKAFIFAESGDDTIMIGKHSNGNLYAGSGSDQITIGGIANGLIDLGSGNEMSDRYLDKYQDGSERSLGNDDNIDTASSENTLTIDGEGTSSTVSHTAKIYGGAGTDNVIIKKGWYAGNAEMDLGNGDNSFTMEHDGIGVNAKVKMGSGNDTVNIAGEHRGTMDLSAGNNAISLGSSSGSIITTDGNDQVTITGTHSGTINLGDGDNEVTIGNGNGDITVGSGNDTIKVNSDYKGNLVLGEGDNTVNIEGSYTNSGIYGRTITTGAGDDSVEIHGDFTAKEINLGNGDNTVSIAGSVSGTIITGEGVDNITLGKGFTGKMNLGAGDDTITVTGSSVTINGTIDGGDGKDTLLVRGAGNEIKFTNIMNVEVIDLTGSGANKLTDVWSDYVKKSTNPIYVKGDAGDQVNLGVQSGQNLGDKIVGVTRPSWTLTSQTTDSDGIEYNVYTYQGDNTTTINIQTDIEVI